MVCYGSDCWQWFAAVAVRNWMTRGLVVILRVTRTLGQLVLVLLKPIIPLLDQICRVSEDRHTDTNNRVE